MGIKGQKGEPGADGTPSSTPAVPTTKFYTKWGRTTCPSGTLVYSGRAGASIHHNAGAGSNLVCLSDTFTTSIYDDVTELASTAFSSIVGVEFLLDTLDPIISTSGSPPPPIEDGKNVPCAVCSTTALACYVQSGSISCPSGGNAVYSGFLMTEQQAENTAVTLDRTSVRFRSHYVCVDAGADPLGDTLTWPVNGGEAGLSHVRVDCAAATSGTNVHDCTNSMNGYGGGQISCSLCCY